MPADRVFDIRAPYCVDEAVSIRPEPFGALAYHYGSRRLTFLRSTLLADLVRQLGEHPSADAALQSLVPAPERDKYRVALQSLFESRFLRAV